MKSLALRLLNIAFILVVIGVPLAQSQTFQVLYSFLGGSDGSQPEGYLAIDGDGNLYGTTVFGGVTTGCQGEAQGGCGTTFVVTPPGGETVLYRFQNGSDGWFPFAGLMLDPRGNMYGTTGYGTGPSDAGNVFKLNPKTGEIRVIEGFSGGTEGGGPHSNLIEDYYGNIYGTTTAGGELGCDPPYGCGVVFKLDGAGKETVLHTFTGPPDGEQPLAGVVEDSRGSLYGTTEGGGTGACPGGGCGTVYKIDSHGTETILHSFGYPRDGIAPYAAVILDDQGNLYGTASARASGNLGLIFRIDAKGRYKVLYEFPAGPAGGPGPDGGIPYAALVRDSAGNLYGTTSVGGDLSCGYMGNGCGAVFRLDPDGNYSVLHAFTDGADGAYPSFGSLLLDASGDLYGLAPSGGINDNGVLFEITP
jgi:uncharacterized repeat protein (TIGR03803 family)